jgi:hypothetical protein
MKELKGTTMIEVPDVIITCDLCGKVTEDYWTISNDVYNRLYIDICPDCFYNRIKPFLDSLEINFNYEGD